MTKTRFVLFAMLLSLCPLAAQEATVDAQIPADYADYIRTVFPGVDPSGEHSLFELKNYTDAGKRHEYTSNMSRLVLLYTEQLEMGPTLSKLFDQYGRGKYAEYATFKVMHAVMLLQFPPNNPNISESEKLLREAAEQHKDFAYPWFFLAQLEMLRMRQEPERGARPTIDALEKAISLQKNFVQAYVLKAQVLINMKPPRTAEVVEMITPLVKSGPASDADDYSDLLQMYFAAAGPEAFHKVVDEHLKNPNMNPRFRTRTLVLKANAYMAQNAYDDAIATLEECAKLTDTKVDPRAAQQLERNFAICWATKAMIAGKEHAEYPQMIEQARKHHLAAADLERKHMPIALRGPEAVVYIDLLVNSLGKVEEALQWLEAYLKETDLTATHRNRLENIVDELKNFMNPTEDNKLTILENYLTQDDMPKLSLSLRKAREDHRTGTTFKTERALNLFIKLLANRERGIVRDAAFLAAETGRVIGGDAIKKAGEAIAEQFKKEIECNTDEQANLQADLSDTIRRLGHMPSIVAVVRHFADLAEKVVQRALLARIMGGWCTDDFLAAYKHVPKKLSAMKRSSPSDSASWLREVADAIQKEIDEG
ncbi:MAG: hypothetical protein IPK87_03815 [Planctomycetes bacterium]|nr:hypothetical protein [Planctomycetota bacterium]